MLALLLLIAALPAEPCVLRSEAPIDQEIKAGEVHHCRLSLAVDQYARLVVEQDGIDLAVTVTREDGTAVTEVNGPGGWHADDSLSLLGSEATGYRIELRGLPGGADPGRYRLRVAEQRPALPEDTVRLAAERAEARADLLYSGQRTAEGLQQSLAHYRTALEAWRSLGEEPREAALLYRIAVVHRQQGENREALAVLSRALALQRKLGDGPEQATLLNQIGLARLNLAEPQEALAAFGEALHLRRAQGKPALVAPVLSNIGLVHQTTGDLPAAQAAYAEALALFRQEKDRQREAVVLSNLGNVHSSLGEPFEALDSFTASLAVARSLPSRGMRGLEAEALNGIGLVRQDLGELQEALESCSAAAAIFRELGDRRREAILLSTLGTLYADLGDPDKALELFDRALALQREMEARRDQGTTLAALGLTHSRAGRPAEALDVLRKALVLQKEAGDRAGEARTLSRLGLHHSAHGQPREALEVLSQALALQIERGDRPAQSLTRLRLGLAQAALGDTAAARSSLNESLRLARQLQSPQAEAAALTGLARLDLDQGDPRAALASLEPAVDLIESLRGQISVDRLRASYFGERGETYELAVEALVRLGEDARAFEMAERARARGLLDLLRQARVGVRAGSDPALHEQERRLRAEISAKAEREMRLQSEPAPEASLAQVRREVRDLLAEYERLDARLHAASPAAAGLLTPAAVKLQEVQNHLLDEETVLLTVALGARRSFLWTVTPSSLKTFELPARAEIEAAARRAHGSLSTPARDGTERREALAALSRLLLQPVAEILRGKRLAVVAGGALQYVPFAALPDPASPQGEPLVAGHEVVSLPSTAVLAELRRKEAGRPPAPSALLLLADPVFRTDDPRVAAAPPQVRLAAASLPPDLERSARQTGEPVFDRLAWTRREAEAVAAQAAPRPVRMALDFDADRTTATGPEPARARVVHFATHGFLNNRSPELSGLVLSLVDRNGQLKDGFLRLPDIYGLHLEADLVVLSGCRTALGREVRGEGLLGLTRGFLYAGAARVMASLWPVRDRATAVLMERFYRALFRDGLPPAAALRAAQLSLREDPGYRDAYFWAPFILQGDWRGTVP